MLILIKYIIAFFVFAFFIVFLDLFSDRLLSLCFSESTIKECRRKYFNFQLIFTIFLAFLVFLISALNELGIIDISLLLN